ncbi:hypothetical protein [Nocardioides sp. URHA0020]|uniref:hypothetical protein n=1 Tax=Nocardioides sp. URHA0020 TaxID=1380392 RepID=UPI00048FC2DA|nr:hypothetical protein [Nocardioides sp. URHA0020]
MSTPTAAGRTSTWVGILLGLVVLGLMAAFAIGLPKANGGEASETAVQELDLTLPDKLPGGYVASDDPAAFEGGQLAAQAADIVKQEKAALVYGNKVLPDVLGTAATTRTYVANGTEAVFVQAFQSTGGAFAPNSIPDPASTGGQAGTELVKVGAGACILSYGQAQAQGQPAPVAFSQCQVTHGGATVQVGSSAVAAKDLVVVADNLLKTFKQD